MSLFFSVGVLAWIKLAPSYKWLTVWDLGHSWYPWWQWRRWISGWPSKNLMVVNRTTNRHQWVPLAVFYLPSVPSSDSLFWLSSAKLSSKCYLPACNLHPTSPAPSSYGLMRSRMQALGCHSRETRVEFSHWGMMELGEDNPAEPVSR